MTRDEREEGEKLRETVTMIEKEEDKRQKSQKKKEERERKRVVSIFWPRHSW